MRGCSIALLFLTRAFAQPAERPTIAAVGTWRSMATGSTRPWAGADFDGNAAPTQFDGVSATLNGTPAYISYVSPTQVNVQVPDGIAVGTAQVVVSYGGQASNTATLNIGPQAPGVLAPASVLYSPSYQQALWVGVSRRQAVLLF